MLGQMFNTPAGHRNRTTCKQVGPRLSTAGSTISAARASAAALLLGGSFGPASICSDVCTASAGEQLLLC